MTRARGRSGRPWRRRREDAGALAAQAREKAAEAFLRLDTAQRDLALSMETLRAVAEEDPGVRDADQRFAALSHAADEASAHYISVMDRHRPESYDDDTDAGTYAQARRELDATRQQLADLEANLARFTESIAPVLARAEGALAVVPAAAGRARAAVVAAHEALVAANGLAGETHTARLAALEESLRELDRGAGALGVSAYVALAERLAGEGAALQEELVGLPALRDDVHRRLASLRTLAQAVESRAPATHDALSALRRKHPARAWRDLEPVPETIDRSVATARARLEEAARAVSEHDWPDAIARLGTVKAMLSEADDAMQAVHERLGALTEVAGDPAAEIERTSFAIRDAQRLALAGRTHAEPRHAERLDAMVHRFEVACEQLDAPYPDWWAFLSEAAAVRAEVASVVQDIRDERARL